MSTYPSRNRQDEATVSEVIRTKTGTAGVRAAIIRSSSACTCDIAAPVKCVCMFVSACAIHGGKHHGTHD